MIGRAILPLAALPAMLLASCDSSPNDTPLEVSVIGERPHIVDPDRQPMTRSAAVLLQATAQGLVAFDAAGQITPALAERWIVTDEGRSFIFRLRQLRWGNGSVLDAEAVARRLRAAVAPHSRNPLKALLGAVDEIDAVTPQVIDIELTSPRPDLIQILAQPEMAILSGGTGSGPFSAAAERDHDAVLLRPIPDPDADEPPQPLPASRDVRLRADRAGVAIARFVSGRSQLVLGGTLGDLPVARAAALPRGVLRFDPVAGLFGFAFGRSDGLLADPDNRRAIAEAIDRDHILTAFDVPGWRAATALVPGGLADLPQPAAPDWADSPLPVRRDEARAQIGRWTASHGPPLTLRIAVPDGPGYRLLATFIILDLRMIGLDAVRAQPGEPADLTLIDAVSPGDVASWYLSRFACAEGHPCDARSEAALDAARSIPDGASHSQFLAEADRQLAALTPFVPIAAPVRWSLVAAALDAWRESPRGLHPLDALRTFPDR